MKATVTIAGVMLAASFFIFQATSSAPLRAGEKPATQTAGDTAAEWLSMQRFKAWYARLGKKQKLSVIRFVSKKNETSADPEIETEFRRYETAVAEYVSKARKLHEQIMDEIRISEGTPPRKKIISRHVPELKKIVTGMVDEEIAHRERMLKIMKRKKDEIISRRVEQILREKSAVPKD